MGDIWHILTEEMSLRGHVSLYHVSLYHVSYIIYPCEYSQPPTSGPHTIGVTESAKPKDLCEKIVQILDQSVQLRFYTC